MSTNCVIKQTMWSNKPCDQQIVYLTNAVVLTPTDCTLLASRRSYCAPSCFLPERAKTYYCKLVACHSRRCCLCLPRYDALCFLFAVLYVACVPVFFCMCLCAAHNLCLSASVSTGLHIPPRNVRISYLTLHLSVFIYTLAACIPLRTCSSACASLAVLVRAVPFLLSTSFFLSLRNVFNDERRMGWCLPMC